MKEFIKNISSWIPVEVKMETKIEAKASEQGADEALKNLHSGVGDGVKFFLRCAGIALLLIAISFLK